MALRIRRGEGRESYLSARVFSIGIPCCTFLSSTIEERRYAT